MTVLVEARGRRLVGDAERAELEGEVRGLLDAATRQVDCEAVLRRFLADTAFMDYSACNRLVLWAQGARGVVMSYSRWRHAGRAVVKGTHGLVVYKGKYPARVAHPISHTEGSAWTFTLPTDHVAVDAAAFYAESVGLYVMGPRARRRELKRVVEVFTTTLEAGPCPACDGHGCYACEEG